MADYAADLDKQESNQLALAGQRQGMADSQALRQATQSFGNDSAANLNALQRAGLYKEAQGYQKSMLDSRKTEGDIAETASKIPLNAAHATQAQADAEAKKQDTAFKAHDKHVQDLQGVTDPQAMIDWFADGIKNKTLDAGKSAAAIATLTQDPSQFEPLRARMMASGVDLKTKYTQEQENARNAATNQTSITTNRLTNDTSRSNNQSTVAQQERNSLRVDARSKESNTAAMTKPFEVTGPDGVPMLVRQDKKGGILDLNGNVVTNLQPKGMGATKLTEDQGKATAWLSQATNAFDNMQAALSTTKSAAKPGINDAIAAIPSFGLGEAAANSMRGKDRQKYMQASSSLSEALLRAATGAGVNHDEAVQKVKELTPQFGDGDDVIAQKMESVPVYIESLKVRAGPGAKQLPAIMERAKEANAARAVTSGTDLGGGFKVK